MTVPGEAGSTVGEDLDELRRLLRLVISGESPSREWAVGYISCRSRLLSSAQRDMLPGFLYQCGTIDRFREFIVLYDPDVELRGEFVDRMIAKARTVSESMSPARQGSSPPDAAVQSPWDF